MTEDEMLELARECAANDAYRFYPAEDEPDIHDGYRAGRFDDDHGVRIARAAIRIMHERGEACRARCAILESVIDQRQDLNTTCPICEGRDLGPGGHCYAGCRDGKVLTTTAFTLKNIRFVLDTYAGDRARAEGFVKVAMMVIAKRASDGLPMHTWQEIEHQAQAALTEWRGE